MGIVHIARYLSGLLALAAVLVAMTGAANAAGSSDYVIQLESDRGEGDLLTFVTYPTYADLVADTNRTVAAGEPRVSSIASTTGLAFDGSNFILMLESDPGEGDLLTFVTYPTYADLVADTNRTVDAGEPRVSSIASTTGLIGGPTFVDSDGDGVPDDQDVCPGEDDTIDVDADGIPDCIDPLIDSDGDGVADSEDLCAGTTDDPAPPALKRNRNWPSPTETFGCSPSQIIDAAGLGAGHAKFGISNSALAAWLASVDE